MKLRSAAILKDFMDHKQFSMARLARYAGCSKGFISHLVAERKDSCTEELARRIAEALDVPVEAIFEPKTSALSGYPVSDERIAS